MLQQKLSNRRSLSFNHRHLNCFIYVIQYVAKLHESRHKLGHRSW